MIELRWVKLGKASDDMNFHNMALEYRYRVRKPGDSPYTPTEWGWSEWIPVVSTRPNE